MAAFHERKHIWSDEIAHLLIVPELVLASNAVQSVLLREDQSLEVLPRDGANLPDLVACEVVERAVLGAVHVDQVVEQEDCCHGLLAGKLTD